MITRREFLQLSAAAAGMVLAGGARGAAPAPPNIVYILADDLGYGDVSCNNPESKIPTPNIDALARQGMRFTDAHSGCAVCTPTRYGVLTGRYSWRSTSKGGVLGPYGKPLIAAGRLTVPALLKRHGYYTACIGKWHLGWNWPTRDGQPDFTQSIADGPTTRGFDLYFGTDVPNYPPYCFIENDRTVGIPTVPKPDDMHGNPGPMLPGWKLEDILPALTRRAEETIAERAKMKQPFFLYFPLTAPHTPIAPAPEFAGRSPLGKYGDFVIQVDDVVGRVMAALKRAGVENDTLLVFTSDNGYAPYIGYITGNYIKNGGMSAVRELEARGHYPSSIYRGYKSDGWEGGHRVAFIARWPGKIAAGAASAEVICHTDLLATAAALVDEKLPGNAGEDSYNLLPVLTGQKLAGPLREATVHQSAQGFLAIRRGQWKLFMCAGAGGWSDQIEQLKLSELPPVQLYDMSLDERERRNVAAGHPEVVASLKALLTRIIREGRSTPGAPQPNDGPQNWPQISWIEGYAGPPPGPQGKAKKTQTPKAKGKTARKKK